MADFYERKTEPAHQKLEIPPELDDDVPVETRILLLLCLDTSGSMAGNPMSEVNDKLAQWCAELRQTPYYARSLEIALVTFGNGGVQVWRGPDQLDYRDEDAFLRLHRFRPPLLSASGGTPMGEALSRSLDIISARKDRFDRDSEQYYRPILWLVSDGEPTDEWRPLVPVIAQLERRGSVLVYAVGINTHVNEMRAKVLSDLCPDRHHEIDVDIEELLALMTASIEAVRGGHSGRPGWEPR